MVPRSSTINLPVFGTPSVLQLKVPLISMTACGPNSLIHIPNDSSHAHLKRKTSHLTFSNSFNPRQSHKAGKDTRLFQLLAHNLLRSALDITCGHLRQWITTYLSIATDCRTFRPRRPSSTAYKTACNSNLHCKFSTTRH